MGCSPPSSEPRILCVILYPLFLYVIGSPAGCTTFTFVNKCSGTVWPGILSNPGKPPLNSTGFELATGVSRSFEAPEGWAGRFWARTGCSFDSSGGGTCTTGDCGSGQVECAGRGAAPPITLAEFTLNGDQGKDFYDVSLVDGYNLAMVVESRGGSGGCAATGCVADLNRRCPEELRAAEGLACRSACDAFGKPEYCCREVYASSATCRPTKYSEVFKSACPKSYSYAFDDTTSTFTCLDADYTITFCPALTTPRQKRFGGPTPATTKGSVSENESWLAILAMGDAASPARVPSLQLALSVSVMASFFVLILL